VHERHARRLRRYGGFPLNLAGALGLKGDLDGGRAALAESPKLKPEINSIAQYLARKPWYSSPQELPLGIIHCSKDWAASASRRAKSRTTRFIFYRLICCPSATNERATWACLTRTDREHIVGRLHTIANLPYARTTCSLLIFS
jgi:hypothetical protein